MRHDAFAEQSAQNSAFAFFSVGPCCLVVWRASGAGGFFYVVLSQCVRIGALAALITSFFTPRYVTASVTALIAYCAIMMLLNFYGAYSYKYTRIYLPDIPYYSSPIFNILWFKKDRYVPVEHGLFAAGFYMYFLLVAYFFAAKHVPLPTRDKK